MSFDDIKFLNNQRIDIKGHDNPWNNRLLWHSGLDINFIKKICNNKVNTIVEFGSYDGGDGIRYKYNFPNASVYSIEASPACYTHIKPLEKYGIRVFNYAISNKNGKATFYETYDQNNNNYAPCGSLRKDYCSTTQPVTAGISVVGPAVASIGDFPLKIMPSIEVPCVTLETFCEEQEIISIDFLHVDVEGHTVEVINGFGTMRPRVIFVEVQSDTHCHSSEIANLLTSMDYKKIASTADDCNEIWIDKKELELLQTTVVPQGEI